MPKATPEQLKQLINEEKDKIAKQEYEVPAEAKEVREKLGIKEEAYSNEAVEKLVENIDNLQKQMDKLIEETKEAKAGSPTGELPEEEKKPKPNLGQYMKSLRAAIYYGKSDDVMQTLGNVAVEDINSQGIPLPKDLLKVLAGSPQYKTTGYLEEGQGSMGGYTVPEQFIPQLLSTPLLLAIMRSHAWTIPGTAKVVKIPRIVETTRSTSVYGGVTGYWTAEGGSITASGPAFGQCELIAKKLALLTYASNELLEDNAVGLNEVLVRLFSEALAWFEDKAFIKGSGVNEPLGLTQANCIKTTATTASHFYLEDAALMFSVMLPSSYTRAIWLMNPSVIPELLAMENIGATNNMWFAGALTVKDDPGAGGWKLFGRPIFFTEFCAALGTATDILFIDPMSYIILDRQDVRVSISTDSRFANDETGYKLTMRSDGQPYMTSTLTLADGSTTVSPVVSSNHA